MSERWDDERLLHWLLDPEAQDAQAAERLALDPAARARLDELARFLEECRASLTGEGAEQAEQAEAGARLLPSVLAATTREDLTWRGDLTVFGRYLRERLRASVALRVAAASLLVHMAALPVLAYLAFVAPTPGYHLSFELPAESPFEEQGAEPDLPVPVPELGEEPRVRPAEGVQADPDRPEADGER